MQMRSYLSLETIWREERHLHAGSTWPGIDKDPLLLGRERGSEGLKQEPRIEEIY